MAARDLIVAGDKASAAKLLQKITKKYEGTQTAARAAEKLSTLEGQG